MNTNDSRTPRDRITDDFRRSLWEEETRNDDSTRTSLFPETAACSCGNSRLSPRTIDTTSQSQSSLAMVISPKQEFVDIYEAEKALDRGTIFAQLDLPFQRTRCPERRCGE